MTITFCLVPFIPLAVLSECSGSNHFLYSILNYENKLLDMKHYSYHGPSVMMLPFWSIIFRVREVIVSFLSFL